MELKWKKQTLQKEQPGSSIDAYLDEWQRAYCVNVLMLLQSARKHKVNLCPPSPKRNWMLSKSRFIIPGFRSQGEVFSQIVVVLARKILKKIHKLDSTQQKGLYLTVERTFLTHIACSSFGLQNFFLSTLLNLNGFSGRKPSFHFILFCFLLCLF